MYKPLTDFRLPNHSLIWILIAQLLTLLPLFFVLPFWLPLLWLTSVAWRYQIIRGKWFAPPHWLAFILGAGCLAGLVSGYGLRMSVELLVGFLVSGIILKVTEAEKIKDGVFILFICFIVIATQLLFNQTILALLYVILCFVCLLCALASLFGSGSVNRKKRLGSSIVILLQALPLAFLLFFIMPRIPPLWLMPSSNSSAQTGFSDTMSPGRISELSKSKATAFRVTIDEIYDQDIKRFYAQSTPSESETTLSKNQIDTMLPSAQRYWRGLVLDAYENGVWSRSDRNLVEDFKALRRASKRPQPLTKKIDSMFIEFSENSIRDGFLEDASDKGKVFAYDVLLEPHKQSWLFTLDAPSQLISSGVPAVFLNDNLPRANKKIVTRMQYRVRSYLNYSKRQASAALFLDPRQRNLQTQLPDDGNRQSRKLVSKWVDDGLSPQKIVDKALNLYRESFYYTLNPPKLAGNQIDDFLFVSKKGFCEHFSGSFVYLMRLAGIPARVVVGYQGGVVNELENYLLVKQSDAHAWAEVWLEGQGWVRVDPTAAVAPNRIEVNLNDALDQSDRADLNSAVANLFSHAFFSGIVTRLDAANYLWQRYIVSYDSNSQKNALLALLGSVTPWKIAVFFFIVTAFFIAMIFVLPNWIRRKKLNQEEMLLNMLERRAKRFGVNRKPSETPTQLCNRLKFLYPDLSARLDRIAKRFIDLLYKKSQSPDEIELLKKEIKSLPRPSN